MKMLSEKSKIYKYTQVLALSFHKKPLKILSASNEKKNRAKIETRRRFSLFSAIKIIWQLRTK